MNKSAIIITVVALIIVAGLGLMIFKGKGKAITYSSAPTDKEELEQRRRYLDSLRNSHYEDSVRSRGSLLDTFGVYKSPIKVLTTKVFTEEYANYKSIKLSWKNVSTKTVTAVRFKWYVQNPFSEPAKMLGSTVNGLGGGYSADRILPNKIDHGVWSAISPDASKVVLAWTYEVVFADGSKWKLSEQ